MYINVTEQKCPICKKIFVPAPYHAWAESKAKGSRLVCSYRCALESDRRRAQKAIYKKENRGEKVK